MKTPLTLFALSFLILLGSCKQVDFVATEGSQLTLSVQPTSVDRNGTATLTVTGIRANGAPLPDGTVVRFQIGDEPTQTMATSSNQLAEGQVTPNPVELRDGVAQVTFIAGNTSGLVTITATSGPAEPDDVTITVGDARAATIVLSADPASLPIGGGRVRLRAFVFDENGNPVSGVQVFFNASAGSLSSRGNAVRTNASGVATDTLITAVDETTVIAQTSTGTESNQITITVVEGEPPVCGLVISPSEEVEIGQQVFFTDTSTDPDGRIVEFTWDFGDGDQASGPNVVHSYREPGTYIVVHSVTDEQGATSICDPPGTVIVVEETQTQTSLSY